MFTKDFWKDAFERAVRTGAQVMLTFLGADGAGLVEMDMAEAGVLTLGGVLASFLTSIMSVGGPDGAIGLTLPGNQREARAAEVGQLTDDDLEAAYGGLVGAEDDDESYGGQVTYGELDPHVRR